MHLAKNGQIGNCCGPNALLTLKEYLQDYASPNVREMGEKMIDRLLPEIPSDKIRGLTADHLRAIANGKRDFRF